MKKQTITIKGHNLNYRDSMVPVEAEVNQGIGIHRRLTWDRSGETVPTNKRQYALSHISSGKQIAPHGAYYFKSLGNARAAVSELLTLGVPWSGDEEALNRYVAEKCPDLARRIIEILQKHDGAF